LLLLPSHAHQVKIVSTILFYKTKNGLTFQAYGVLDLIAVKFQLLPPIRALPWAQETGIVNCRDRRLGIIAFFKGENH